MGRSEVRGLLTPINGRIVGCHGKPCDYMSNLFLGIAKVLQKSAKKLLTIVMADAMIVKSSRESE